MKRSRMIYNRIEYILFRAALGSFRLLPQWLSKAVLIGLFDLIGYRIGIRRKLADVQLKTVYPEMDKARRKQILRRMYRHMALTVWDCYIISDKQLFQKSRFENMAFAEEALSRKKGALLITGHFGNWESPFRVLAMQGFGVAGITKKQRNHLFDRYTNAIRERQGGTIIDMKNALRGVLAHTAHNDLIGILIDQDAGRKGVLMDFLGKPASNWKGTAKIALKFKIPIIPGYVIRDEQDKLVFRFEKMIDPLPLEDTDENMLKLIETMNSSLEEKIRQYPEQWFWVHKRWKGARHFDENGVLKPRTKRTKK